MRSANTRAIDLRLDDQFKIDHLMQDRILVRPEKAESIIQTIDSLSNKPTRGEVLAVGPGMTTKKGVVIPIDIRIGDRIVFGPHATTEILFRGEKLLITREENVVGVEEG